MKRLASLLLAVSLNVSAAFGATLDSLFNVPNLWSLKHSEFAEHVKDMGFEWTSSAKDSARASHRSLTVFGLPAVEAIARFSNETLKEITVTIYARGDAGDINKTQYEALIRGAVESLNRGTGAKFTVRGKDATNAVKADGIFWQTPQSRFLLEYSATKEMKSRDIPFRAEFVRLEVTPPPKGGGLVTATTTTTLKAKFNGHAHIKKDPATGDVFVTDVPMIDQGQKGYCVVASAERVMRYYGAQVDSNELAQIANSDATGGTSYDDMFSALKKVSARLKVRVRQQQELTVRGILDLMKDYNRVAKRTGKPEIPDQGLMLDLGYIYRQMDFATLKETKTKNRSDVSRFQRDIVQRIDEGVPLLWAVQLGMVPEPGIPQNAGGHMRLIIGYNTKTNELYFSDSWGAGHERKKMAIDDAWTITTGLATIEPL